ncbi:MAG: nucleoside deaminase [Leptolyngbya sp. SIOISBB]|nr:nucleoside deaminase [Leptolyngbya sp. SIOISBB]
MAVAIALSKEAIRSERGGPYGAVVVKEGEIIGQGMNEVTSINDPTAHAEMTAIRQACEQVGNWNLSGCELYTSCEPCPMCLGAIYWARLDKVYYGNTKEVAAQFGFNSQYFYDEVAKPREARQITMQPLMPEAAVTAFEEWKSLPDKQSY